MKTSQRGNAAIILLIIGILVIAGGVFAYTKYFQPQPSCDANPSPCPDYGGFGPGITQYNNPTLGFSLQYPSNFILKEDTFYYDDSRMNSFKGIRISVPKGMYAGTNFAEGDSDIEVINNTQSTTCTAQDFKMFLGDSVTVGKNSVSNGITMSSAVSGGVAAGQIYDFTIHTTLNHNPCIGLVLRIHTSNLGNYDSGAVKGFDDTELNSIFDQIASSFKFIQ
jgi:hypothetical protein